MISFQTLKLDQSLEAIQKMKNTVAARPKKDTWNKGKKLSEEDRMKISDGLKNSEQFQATKYDRTGCVLSEETRAKMSKSRKGKSLTQAHKQAIIDGHQRRQRSLKAS